MTAADDYRANALEARSQADAELDPVAREKLNMRAEQWEELALTVEVLNQLESATGKKKDESLDLD
jgi:hypothetical protein